MTDTFDRHQYNCWVKSLAKAWIDHNLPIQTMALIIQDTGDRLERNFPKTIVADDLRRDVVEACDRILANEPDPFENAVDRTDKSQARINQPRKNRRPRSAADYSK